MSSRTLVEPQLRPFIRPGLTALSHTRSISIGATVLSLGMTYTVVQLVAPLRRVGLVVAMVVLNAVLIPAIACCSPQAR